MKTLDVREYLFLKRFFNEEHKLTSYILSGIDMKEFLRESISSMKPFEYFPSPETEIYKIYKKKFAEEKEKKIREFETFYGEPLTKKS